MGAGEGMAAVQSGARATGTFAVKAGLARMLKGGVIMDVVNVEQARIAEEAGSRRYNRTSHGLISLVFPRLLVLRRPCRE